MNVQQVRFGGRLIAIALMYSVLGAIGLMTAIPPGHATPLWPPAGIAFAVLLLAGRRYWPAIFVGSLILNSGIVIHETGTFTLLAFGASFVMATGSAAGYLAGTNFVRASGSRAGILARTKNLMFFFGGASAAAAIAATFGTTGILFSGPMPSTALLHNWTTWFVGDLAGILVIAPLIIASFEEPAQRITGWRVAEAAAIFLILVGTLLVFFYKGEYPLAYLPLPVLVFTAFRFRIRGATSAILVVGLVSAVETVEQRGPFAVPGLQIHESLLLLQTYMIVLVVTTLAVAAVIAERQKESEEAESERLRALNAELRATNAEHLALAEQARLREEALARQLIQEELRTAYVLQTSSDLIWRMTPEGIVQYVSPAAKVVLQFEPEEIVTRSIFDFVHPDDVDENRELQMELLQRTSSCTLSCRMRRRDGRYLWIETTSRAIREDDGRFREIVAVSRDITERKNAEEQIEHQAYHDPLTGLPNRILFEDRIAIALAQARRFGRGLSIMFLDLDRFKSVNDSLGHMAGDQLLQEAAWRLKGCLREIDTVARMGGDEFTLLLPEVEGSGDAISVARKVVMTLSEPYHIQDMEFFVGVSVGIAMYPIDGSDTLTLLRSADDAMYRAKQSGGNAWQLHAPDMRSDPSERLMLETALRNAVKRDEFEVMYQPQIDMQTREVVAAEALVRWRHPQRGVLLPDDFIHIAEDCGLIGVIGEKVLRTACAQAKRWRDGRFPNLRLAVNISPRQFRNHELVPQIRSILDETGLPGTALELEITETTAMQSAERTMEMINALKEHGIRVSIDDFGTGYSSLSYLRRFAVDNLKIDKSFMNHDENNQPDHEIVSAVIRMTHALKLGVVAEGVETEEQRKFLEKESCDFVQGYLFSRPLSPEGFEREDWITEKTFATT